MQVARHVSVTTSGQVLHLICIVGWGVECSEWKPEQDFAHEELVEQFEHAA